MTYRKFYIVLALCALLIGLKLVETWFYQSWERDLNRQREYQMKGIYAEHTDLFTNQFLRRLGHDALSDPAMMAMLKKNGINMKPVATTPLEAPTVAAPATPENP